MYLAILRIEFHPEIIIDMELYYFWRVTRNKSQNSRVPLQQMFLTYSSGNYLIWTLEKCTHPEIDEEEDDRTCVYLFRVMCATNGFCNKFTGRD